MKKQLFYCLLSCTSLCSITGHALEVSKTYVPKKKSMYHKEWIDFNKNGRKDIYEDPKAPLNERIEDLLSQMTVEEKDLPDGHALWVSKSFKRFIAYSPIGKTSYGKTVSELSMSI